MAAPLSVVPAPPKPTNDEAEPIVTPRRLAPYVLEIFLQAHHQGRRCTLEDLCARLPVRRQDLRRTVTALHHNDLVDAYRGKLTLRGFAVALALAPQCRVPLRDALLGWKPCLREEQVGKKLAKAG